MANRPPNAMRQRLRRAARTVRYRTPASGVIAELEKRVRRGQRSMGKEGWNAALAGDFAFYCGGNLFTDLRNAVITELVRHHLPGARAALDVGCAAGSLAPRLRSLGVMRYVGTDISDVAISKADRALGDFVAADLREFEPPGGGGFDVIIFNEVLYYIDVEQAVAQVERYCGWLREGGMICVSMTDDPKSQEITARIARRMRWVDGVLYQDQRSRPVFRMSRLLPRAHLVGLLAAQG